MVELYKIATPQAFLHRNGMEIANRLESTNVLRINAPAKKCGAVSRFSYRVRMAVVSLWAALVTVAVFFVSLLTWRRTISGWLYARGLNVLAMRILGIRLTVEGSENLPTEPSVLLVNHQSNFDAFFLGGVFPRRTVVVAKKEMQKVPLFGVTLKASRTIFVDREDSADAKRALKAATQTLKADKNNIWIFPEGTRSKGRGLGEFKKGAFAMAIAAEAPIIPVVNQTLEHTLDTQNKILRPGTHHVRILPAISTKGLKLRDIDALRERVVRLFEKELAELSTRRSE